MQVDRRSSVVLKEGAQTSGVVVVTVGDYYGIYFCGCWEGRVLLPQKFKVVKEFSAGSCVYQIILPLRGLKEET